MALSYTEYNGDGSTTTFTTPKYLQEDHLVVTVNGVLKSFPTDYSVSGETITFVDAPLSTARVRIGRKTSQAQRLNDYQDGSLLTADVMDDDANQMFFMAQEAIDTASETNFFSNSFYSSSTTAPELANLGDLWYDATNKYLKIYNGTQWDRATPSNETLTFTAFETSGSYSYVSVADLNEEVFVFLNGVKQVKGDSLASLAGVDAKDYFPDVQANRIYFNTLASSDVVQVVIAAADVAGRSSTVVETFTAAANQQVFTLAETYVPAINSVSVYVDGARKTLGTDYTETSNTTISFSSPLTGGEEVVCVINEYSTVTEPTSASLVNFTNAASGVDTVQDTLTSLNTTITTNTSDIASNTSDIADRALVLLETQTASSDASIDFTSSIDSTYKKYVVELINVVPSTDGAGAICRVGNGGSFDSGASDYGYTLASWRTTMVISDNFASSGMTVCDTSISNIEAEGGLSGDIVLFDPASPSHYTSISSELNAAHTTANTFSGQASKGRRLEAAAHDRIQFLFSSGNIASGTFKLYGVK